MFPIQANARTPTHTTSSSKPDLTAALLATAADEEALDQRSNPHFDRSLAGPLGDPSGALRARPVRALRFNQKGKFVRLAEQIRAEARLEELKKRIAESSRKAGLDGEIEAIEKQVRVGCVWLTSSYLHSSSTSPTVFFVSRSDRPHLIANGGTKTTCQIVIMTI